jgi:hypothetical protein
MSVSLRTESEGAQKTLEAKFMYSVRLMLHKEVRMTIVYMNKK